MKSLFRVLILSLVSVSAFAQLQTFRGDTLGPLVPNRVNIGAAADGRGGQKGTSGYFRRFAFVDEVTAATAGGVTSVNSKTGSAITLQTSDVGENVNLYFTSARARAALTGVGPLSVNSSTGAITFAGAPGDVQLGNINNTSDANKPISIAQQGGLDLKANLTSSIYRVNVATFAALTALTVPTGNTYFVKVASDETQAAPYNTNQWYGKDDTGATFKFSLIKQ
ncbi:hypothetical protein [Spirosoma flavum]|uniref:Uncharacterized protein n=1 Tax=Spirosoma flavum TaxID=2048557 RepID=A0ABW6AQH9_9BACT